MTTNPLIEAIKTKIQAQCWTTQSVFPDQEIGAPGFTYTIGLHETFRHPEIIVFGLHPSISQQILVRTVHLIEQGGSIIERQPYRDILNDLPIVFRAIPLRRQDQYLLFAKNIYGGAFTSLQLIWPDAAGRFPWDAAFDPKFARDQPALYEKDF